ncbi:MAG: pyrroloquinoline-quinone synthase PqqC [Candidatus Eremiobacteraeota bacterium]|nr:pyrroloquinoline-quinone synthase PqqC [Candidatus Eremiobacteraeota bacterium]
MGTSPKPDGRPEDAQFVERLRSVGERRYHDKHPFHRAMHAGVLTPEQIRGWVANRYYYQKSIPIKDAAILSNLPDREKRRVWIQRIIDHDGTLERGGGGIESWLALARAVGLDEDEVASERRVLPGTRFAADAYVTFARTQPWLPAVASSLTELFAPELMSQRIAVLAEKYPWIADSGLAYFRSRLELAPKDAAYALRWVCENATSEQAQAACIRALEFKCDVLWAILDATQAAYGAGAGEAVRT